MNLSPRPFVVMCTTENGMTKIQEALQSGADEYIMKPYDQEVLKDKLEALGLLEHARAPTAPPPCASWWWTILPWSGA